MEWKSVGMMTWTGYMESHTIHVPNHQPNIISIHKHTSCPDIFLLVPNASPWLLDFALSGFHRDIPLSLIASTENKSSAKYISIPCSIPQLLSWSFLCPESNDTSAVTAKCPLICSDLSVNLYRFRLLWSDPVAGPCPASLYAPCVPALKTLPNPNRAVVTNVTYTMHTQCIRMHQDVPELMRTG